MSQSIFSRIASREVDAHIVFETERIMAILDIAPATRGHTILFPKEEYQVLAQVPDDVLVDLFLALRIVRHATLVHDDSISGLTSFIAQGSVAGQRAPHVLIHTIPRRGDDGLFPAELAQQAAALNAPIFDRDDGLIVEQRDPARAASEIRIVDERADVFEELEASRIGIFAAGIRQVSSSLFESLDAQGTNVFIESGSSQDRAGALAFVLARSEGDGLSFDWDPTSADDLRSVADGFGSALARIEKREPKRSEPEEERRPTNYLLKQLERVP